MCLLTRCGPELRRYTEKPGGGWRTSCSFVMFFFRHWIPVLWLAVRDYRSNKVVIRNVSQLPLGILLHIVTNSNVTYLTYLSK